MIRRHTITDLLRRTAHRMPDKTALICGDTTWTYKAFYALVRRLAAGLAANGVGEADKVAVLSRNSHSFAALRFAVAELGAVLVPINFMLSADEAGYILKHSEAKMLSVDSEFADTGRQAARDSEVTQFLWLPGEKETRPEAGMLDFNALAACQDAPPQPDIDGEAMAQIIYTSGTESLPKGAMLSHNAVIWQYVSCLVDIEIERGDVILHALPLYHCAQLDVFFGPGIYVGCTNVITARPAPDNLLALMAKYQINSFFAPPTVWIGLLRSPQFEETDLSCLQKGYYGASIMPVEVLREIQQRLPQLRLWNCYGQTEIAPLAVVLKPEDQMPRAGSAGLPVINVETRVVTDDGREVGAGEVGEIVHRSPQLLTGYYRDEEKTREAFRGGWFHSGDLATVDEDGYIAVVDRKKDMIKSGGENVASREVEETIYRMPQVAEVAVIGLPDPRWVEAVTAIVVPRADSELREQDVIDHCGATMARFKVPKKVFFADSLPKNPSGKILKRELRTLYES